VGAAIFGCAARVGAAIFGCAARVGAAIFGCAARVGAAIFGCAARVGAGRGSRGARPPPPRRRRRRRTGAARGREKDTFNDKQNMKLVVPMTNNTRTAGDVLAAGLLGVCAGARGGR